MIYSKGNIKLIERINIMERKIVALLVVSAISTSVFVGCSCTKSVDNDKDDMNKIAVESDVTISSTIVTTTAEGNLSSFSDTSSYTTTGTTTSMTGTTTSKSIPIQFVGNPNARRSTANKETATVTVIVTVTLPQTTISTMETTTVTTLETQNMPDGNFNPDDDMRFKSNDIIVKVGDLQPSLASYAVSVSEGSPVHGGTISRTYQFDDFYVVTEELTKEDGASGEFITDIVLSSEKVCTNKGIKKGATIDEIYAAYGMEKCLNEEINIYRYKTDDGYVMEFCTDGTYVTEIKYYMVME